jgi:SNF2 family DNA or RNA helicase
LHPLQAAGVRWLLDHPRAVLADDTGTGKTVTVAGLLAALHAQGELHPAVVVVPSVLHGAWLSKLNQFVPGLSVVSSTEKRWANPTGKQRLEYLREFLSGYPDVPKAFKAWFTGRRAASSTRTFSMR